MAEWIEKRSGTLRPKQFCAFTGGRTMLQHTLDRARLIAPAKNTITVITRGQRRHLDGAIDAAHAGRIVEQPVDRGTAAGVLTSAAYILASDPEATLLVLPSDHFVHPDWQFQRHVERACRLAETCKDRFVLLGAIPEGPETDYGWILHEEREEPAAVNGSARGVWRITHFQEKPGWSEAERFYRAGGLWNTMVVAVKVRTLWEAASGLLPEMVERLEFLVHALQAFRDGRADAGREGMVLTTIYRKMPQADFSRDILKHVAGSALVLAMRDMEWSDWGRPTRVEETIRRLASGRGPNDIVHCALDRSEAGLQATGELQ
jgi:mannose-1-phosphate guanylyltransferase